MKKLCAFAIFTVMAIGCGGDPASDAYLQLTDQGWTSYEAQDYTAAQEYFTQAVEMDPSRSEGYSGLGWTSMKQDDLPSAENHFQSGVSLGDAGADIHAGRAFVNNALKSYVQSNTSADLALDADADWLFAHQITLSASDLKVLKAENFFAQGDFTASLNAVKVVNPAFSADVSNSVGQSQLSAEIERLKTIN